MPKKLRCDRCGLELSDPEDIDLAMEGRDAWHASVRSWGREPRGVFPCENYMRCRGEMVGAEIHVLAVDSDGTVLVDEIYITSDNGFFEIWFPRDREINMTLEAGGKTASGIITTYDDSNTCMTTFKLE